MSYGLYDNDYMASGRDVSEERLKDRDLEKVRGDHYREGDKVICWKCGRMVRVRKDIRLSKHNTESPYDRTTQRHKRKRPCVASGTKP